MTRTNMFADLSFNIPLVKFVARSRPGVGRHGPSPFNTFSGKGIVDSRLYGSVGLRFSW